MLLEPACPAYLRHLYGLHTKRPTVKEKSYSVAEYKKFIAGAGLSFTHHNYKNYMYRGAKSGVLYYLFMQAVPDMATGLLPCTQVIIGDKKI
jgi:hypothetical protein